MKNLHILSAVFVLFFVGFSAQTGFAQKKARKKTVVQTKINWSGKWTVPSRYAPNNLEVKAVKGNQFEFVLEGYNGANSGTVKGRARINGIKAVYDDRTSTDAVAEKSGCVLTFTHKGEYIDVEQTSECDYYAGNAVVFAGQYQKDVMLARESDFVYLKVFPDKPLDADFKKLVGWDYEKFLNSFHLISEEDNLDDFDAKIFSACVRGICPYNAAIIMYDDVGSIWAAVIYPENTEKTIVNYYSNVPFWMDKMPKTIEKWVNEKKELNKGVIINFKS